jgi:hypothetical protein
VDLTQTLINNLGFTSIKYHTVDIKTHISIKAHTITDIIIKAITTRGHIVITCTLGNMAHLALNTCQTIVHMR